MPTNVKSIKSAGKIIISKESNDQEVLELKGKIAKMEQANIENSLALVELYESENKSTVRLGSIKESLRSNPSVPDHVKAGL
jgi:hypothetical protein